MAFVTTHLLNHALGLVSLAWMEAGQRAFFVLWGHLAGQIVLYGAFLTHVALGLVRLYRRRSLHLPGWEALQIALGLAIPLLLAGHVVGTRVAESRFGIESDYPPVLRALWPDAAFTQLLLIAVVWLHGCMGLHYWLRLEPWYGRVRAALFGSALLLPVLAVLGFVQAGRVVDALPPETLPPPPTAAQADELESFRLIGLGVFLSAVAAVLAGRLVRSRVLLGGRRPRVRYLGGGVVVLQPGMSILEASRSAGVPHAAVCGGRGRCSTCRVRIVHGADALPEAEERERRVLARIGAQDDVRLACQLRPRANVTVDVLLPPTVGAGHVDLPADPAHGVERELAVLFADLRDFTRFAERRLPYDVVFLLNAYFGAMGGAIDRAGGHVDKFIGDGVMALFGIDRPPEEAARQALEGARGMALALDHLNRDLAPELRESFSIGIGVHLGPVILGEIGHRNARSLTAVGDSVNVASRLEQLTKEHGVQLVVSASVAERAGCDLRGVPAIEIAVRGRSRPLQVYLVEDARSLPVPAPPDADRRQGVLARLGLAGRSA